MSCRSALLAAYGVVYKSDPTPVPSLGRGEEPQAGGLFLISFQLRAAKVSVECCRPALLAAYGVVYKSAPTPAPSRGRGEEH